MSGSKSQSLGPEVSLLHTFAWPLTPTELRQSPSERGRRTDRRAGGPGAEDGAGALTLALTP